ncbi:hypothetical protein LTR94_031567, partial [Friedmanniomyces endolithicus]
MLGATDRQVARLFQRRIALDAGIGAVAGSVVAAIAILIVARQVGALESQLLGGLKLAMGDLAMLIALPFGFVALAVLAARLAAARVVSFSLEMSVLRLMSIVAPLSWWRGGAASSAPGRPGGAVDFVVQRRRLQHRIEVDRLEQAVDRQPGMDREVQAVDVARLRLEHGARVEQARLVGGDRIFDAGADGGA